MTKIAPITKIEVTICGAIARFLAKENRPPRVQRRTGSLRCDYGVAAVSTVKDCIRLRYIHSQWQLEYWGTSLLKTGIHNRCSLNMKELYSVRMHTNRYSR